MVVFTIVGVVVAVLVATVGVLALLLSNKRRRYAHLPSPPLVSFWLGHVALLEEKVRSGGFSEDLTVELAKKYGPVFVMWLAHLGRVVVSDPKAARQILSDPDALKPQLLFRSLKYTYGNRFLGGFQASQSDMDKWRRRHKIVGPFFSRKNTTDLLGPFNQTLDKFIAYIDKAAETGEFVPMKVTFPSLTSAVIATVAVGEEITKLEELFPLTRALDDVLDCAYQQMENPLSEYLPTYRNVWQRARKSCNFLRETGKRWIVRRQKEILEGAEYGNDLLSLVLKATATNGEYSLEELIDTVVDAFFGGHKTTSLTLTFALKEILTHPEVKDRLVKEVDEVLEGKQFVSPTHLTSLKYLNCVLKETLRRHPVLTGGQRTFKSDFTAAGHKIPADSWIELSFYTMHLDDKNWPNPKKFDPERFASLTGEDGGLPYFPFGGGVRMCTGRLFADQEMKMAMSRLFQKFTIELEQGGKDDNKYREYLLLCPTDPINCKFTRRQEK
ncbi:cholesterol 24-hydroxylase-like [Corticium candelabrum]|uniref:cholesterol 24-hydroxylase-like n=1 Tax=Corticium candelabrum TaxID=121492 RepID=UPI002E25AE4F|nr:cholesterol 24-hydroxylase-like [Corticium candelabrum]